MAVSNKPIFTQAVVLKTASIATANTNRDGTTGTYATLVTGGTNGTRIEKIVITGAGTVTAGVVRVFNFDGTTTALVKEQLITATTPSTTVEAFRAELVNTDGRPYILLKASDTIKVSTHNAETFHVTAYGGDF